MRTDPVTVSTPHSRPRPPRQVRHSCCGWSQALMGMFLVCMAWLSPAAAEGLRLAVLKYGTANWELDVIRRHGLDQAQGLTLEVKDYAGPQATLVALQAGEADLAINDWIWVAHQRQAGRPFTFHPYSTASGALVVPQGSPIRSLADLTGRRLGVAGGPEDKNWLILRALGLKELGRDPAQTLEPVYGAPPLLSEQLKEGRLDGVVTYWHAAARLEATGHTVVLPVRDALQGLGLDPHLPLLGYCFDETWAMHHGETLRGFFRAAEQARALLRDSDQEWDALRPLMAAPDEATFIALRKGYRAGIPTTWGASERAAAARLFGLLQGLTRRSLAETTATLPAGTFWDGATPEQSVRNDGG